MKSRQCCTMAGISSPKHMPAPKRTEADRMKIHFELGHDAEISSASTQRPK